MTRRPPAIGKSRLEAFSDGVLAIILTIMVLEMKPPRGDSLADLEAVVPVFLAYVLSFVYVGIYWNNHHHMLQTCRHVTGPILWANLHLLFWLSVVPFTTAWMGANDFSAVPVAVYGGVLFLAGISYYLLEQAIIASQGPDSLLKRAVGGDRKGLLSLAIYAVSVPTAFWAREVSLGLYIAVALLWLAPDLRIERVMADGPPRSDGDGVH